MAGYTSCSSFEPPRQQAQAALQEWLGYKEVLAVFGIKRSNLYGRLSLLVRTRQLPGESKKWSRSDLERLVQQFTVRPEPSLTIQGDRGPAVVPRRSKRKRPLPASPSSITFRYLK